MLEKQGEKFEKKYKRKDKPVREPSRPTILQQFKAEIGDAELQPIEVKQLQQKYGISNAELILSEKNLIEKEDGIGIGKRNTR